MNHGRQKVIRTIGVLTSGEMSLNERSNPCRCSYSTW